MKKMFIRFLKLKKLHSFTDITPPVIAEFQNYLLRKGKKPQTVNWYLGSIHAVFPTWLCQAPSRKTMMNAGGLGEDIEEYFMGHKTSGDVSKRYNHKGRQG
jgi:hypothetical protein